MSRLGVPLRPGLILQRNGYDGLLLSWDLRYGNVLSYYTETINRWRVHDPDTLIIGQAIILNGDYIISVRGSVMSVKYDSVFHTLKMKQLRCKQKTLK